MFEDVHCIIIYNSQKNTKQNQPECFNVRRLFGKLWYSYMSKYYVWPLKMFIVKFTLNRKVFSKINENDQYIIWKKYVKMCMLIDETRRWFKKFAVG